MLMETARRRYAQRFSLAAMLMRGRRREMGSNTEATTIGHRWGWNCCVLFNWALMSFSRVAVSRTMVSRTGGGACSVSNMNLLFGGNLWCQCWGRSVKSVVMLHAYLFVKTHYRLKCSSPVSRLQWQRDEFLAFVLFALRSVTWIVESLVCILSPALIVNTNLALARFAPLWGALDVILWVLAKKLWELFKVGVKLLKRASQGIACVHMHIYIYIYT